MEGNRSSGGDLMGRLGRLVANQSRRPFPFGYCLRRFAWYPYRNKFMDDFQHLEGPPGSIFQDHHPPFVEFLIRTLCYLPV